MIDAAIDNFDQNEETLDGKSTTHAIAKVIYQHCDKKISLIPIPRCSQRASGCTRHRQYNHHLSQALHVSRTSSCDVPVAHKNMPEYN